MGGRGRTAVLKGDTFPAIPNLEPWDGKDGEVSWTGGAGVGRDATLCCISVFMQVMFEVAAGRFLPSKTNQGH